MKEIYQQTVEKVFERVKGNISGLTSEQVKSSREKCGWNELAEGKKKNILQIFWNSTDGKSGTILTKFKEAFWSGGKGTA